MDVQCDTDVLFDVVSCCFDVVCSEIACNALHGRFCQVVSDTFIGRVWSKRCLDKDE